MVNVNLLHSVLRSLDGDSKTRRAIDGATCCSGLRRRFGQDRTQDPPGIGRHEPTAIPWSLKNRMCSESLQTADSVSGRRGAAVFEFFPPLVQLLQLGVDLFQTLVAGHDGRLWLFEEAGVGQFLMQFGLLLFQ